MTVRMRVLLVTATALGGLGLTACSGQGSTVAVPSGLPSTSIGLPSVPVPTVSGFTVPPSVAVPSVTAPSVSCSDVTDRIESALSSFPNANVTTSDGCSAVAISAPLPPGSAGTATARLICQAASKVAYNGSVTKLTVSDSGGKQLVSGSKGGDCTTS